MSTLLELRGLRAGYGTIEVLHSIDLQVPEGGIFAVLGPNGAGKSTLLRVISGLHPVAGGSVILAGRTVNGAEPESLAAAGLCLVPEGRGIFPNLTVTENLRLLTHLGPSMAEIQARTFERFPRLGERRRQLAGTLSGGEQQMLALARAVATDPAFLLIDELSMGLAPRVVDDLYALVHDLAQDGLTVLAVEQFARAILGIADHAVVMAAGTIVHEGDPDQMAGELAELYLGTTA